MYNKMNRVVFIPVITLIVLAMVLAPVSAQTVVDQTSVKGAFGMWDVIIGGEGVVIKVFVWDIKESTREISIDVLFYFESGDDNEFEKILIPSEFTWSFGACRVSTEIIVEDEGGTFILPITVEWDMLPPTLKDKSVVKTDSVHIVSNHVSREGVATLTTITTPDGPEVTFPNGFGQVWKTTHVYIAQ